MVHASGLKSKPSISCIEVPNKPKIKLIIATNEIKAINIAATFAASFRPSVAPPQLHLLNYYLGILVLYYLSL